MSKPVTRREFLNLIAAASGTATVLAIGGSLGLLPASATATVPQLAALGENRRKVAILGGGISGLTVAYELSKAGYDCEVLEAASRCGGRIVTYRHGDVIDEIGNPQRVRFDNEPHMYFNAGAARIPGSHRNTLHYCRELDVELEIFINENKLAWVQDDNFNGGKPVRNVEFSTNTRGFMAEMLHKAFDRIELDQPFTDEEGEKLLTILRQFGDLDPDGRYTGSMRAGYAEGGFITTPTQKELIHYKELLKAGTGIFRSVLMENEGETGPILMAPRGGMDMIIKGYERQLPGKIRYNAMVMSVNLKENGVDVVYEQNGQRRLIEADYVFNCIPTNLMAGITNNFPRQYTDALKYIRRGEAFKAAFQAKERFWEKQDIYGGISWTNQPIRQIWYPAHSIGKKKGIILAAYDYGGGMHFTRMTQEQRIEELIRQGEKVHPDYRDQVEHGITVAWHRMNHMLGCSARWGAMTPEAEVHYRNLQAPVGNHYMIGDQISRRSAWMESAIQSAHLAMADMNQKVRAELASA